MCVDNNKLYERKEKAKPRLEETEENKILIESERDSAIIIHSAAFRRLQNKMQVQVIGDSDYYRTRLTHTLEVMQIARGILYHLQNKISEKLGEMQPNIHLIEAVCFAHDIGHPPFGHAGEEALNECMEKFGGFEGNAQTLHILSSGTEHSKYSGFNLMRRTLLGVVKYPVTYSTLNNCNYKDKAPKCIYDKEQGVLDWLLEPFSNEDKKLFQEYKPKDDKHGKSKYKSFDCSIMNMADDIAYACHDLEDAVKLSILKREKVKSILMNANYSDISFLLQILGGYSEGSLEKNIDKFLDGLYSSYEYKKFFSGLIGFFINGCEIQEVDGFTNPLLKYNIGFKSKEYYEILELLKDEITYKNVIANYKIIQMEYKGKKMVKDVFNAFINSNGKLLPPGEQQKYNLYKDDKNKQARVICDYIAGMSDNFLTMIYSRLFVPNYGSIGDLL